MSNGDDVLDNWEEIDEAGLNTTVQKLKISSACERITNNVYRDNSFVTAIPITLSTTSSATSCSNFTQMKVLQRATTEDSTPSVKSLAKSSLDDMSATFQPVMMVLHKPQDEYQSANYTPPIANQTVKILRRPTQSTEPRNNDIRPKQPIKTLQQREQEYAEARLRILGSAKNPEDDEQRATTSPTASVQTVVINSTLSTPAVTTSILTNSPFSNMVANTKLNTPKISGGPNQYNNLYNQQLQQYQQSYQQQQQQQNYFYSQQQQQQQQPQSPAFSNNNRTYTMNPLLGLGPMGAIGQPAQCQPSTLSSPQIQQTLQPQQSHLKYQQYHQKSPQQQHKAQQQKQQQQQTWSPVVGGSVSSSSIRQQNDTILRLPRGPDGTTGFQIRR